MADKACDLLAWERKIYENNAKRIFEDDSESNVRNVMVSKSKSLVDLIKEAICKAVEELSDNPCFYHHRQDHKDYKELIIMMQNTSYDITYAQYNHRDVEKLMPRISGKYNQDLLNFERNDKQRYELYENAILVAIQEKEVQEALRKIAENPYRDPTDADWDKYEAKLKKKISMPQKPKSAWQKFKKLFTGNKEKD